MNNQNRLLIGAAILIIGASIILHGYLISVAMKTTQVKEYAKEYATVLNLSQAATYMNLTEDELLGIIKTETDLLNEYHSFSGKMFPYFIVNDQFYFYKDGIDEWLMEATTQRHNYNTSKGWLNSGPTE